MVDDIPVDSDPINLKDLLAKFSKMLIGVGFAFVCFIGVSVRAL